jgi:hypothetical protein
MNTWCGKCHFTSIREKMTNMLVENECGAFDRNMNSGYNKEE